MNLWETSAKLKPIREVLWASLISWSLLEQYVKSVWQARATSSIELSESTNSRWFVAAFHLEAGTSSHRWFSHRGGIGARRDRGRFSSTSLHNRARVSVEGGTSLHAAMLRDF